MKRFLVFLTIVVLGVLVPVALLAQGNPTVGTWKLNTAKTKFNPGPAPQSTMQTYEAQGNGLKFTSEGTAGDGSHSAWSYAANYDRKDNPISGTGTPNGADTVALKRINSNTTEATFKKAGKVVVRGRWVVSRDGKVMTITAKGTNGNGQPTTNLLIFDKQ